MRACCLPGLRRLSQLRTSRVLNKPPRLASLRASSMSFPHDAASTPRSRPGASHCPASGLSVTSLMCGGNIEVESLADPSNIELFIRADPFSPTDQRSHFQWFNYRMAGTKGKSLKMHLKNAGQASYPSAWAGYQACASYDGSYWFRVHTEYDSQSGALTIAHAPEHDAVHYAYFAPYTMQQHDQLVHKMQVREGVQLKVIGQTLDGRNMDLLQISQDTPGQPHKARVWIVARQHPGETQAEWFMEGLLNRLTDSHDPMAKAALKSCVFYCIPNMCPDGSARGHLRTNAAGMNLNRVWRDPDVGTAPEVHHTLQAMHAEGVDFMLDVHGDEELPYCFVSGLSGIPSWGPRLQRLQTAFCQSFMKHSPDFQVTYGYPHDAPGKANLNLCSKQIGERFNVLSLTLEMPFKDNCELPDTRVGWSPRRSMLLGASSLGAIVDVAPQLRSS